MINLAREPSVPATAPGMNRLLPRPLTRDFLLWVAGGPRTSAEAMEAWRSSCPR